MAKLVTADWVAERLDSPEFRLIDPRRPMKYLSGHLPGALNVPVYKAFGADGRLMAPKELAEFIGGCGLGDGPAPIIYDSPEGQNAAMLAWIIEYLGHPESFFMDCFFEHWQAEHREVTYRPVNGVKSNFTAGANPSLRATLPEVRDAKGARLVDFRSREEFSGERTMADDPPGHLAGAVNVVWRDLSEPPERVLRDKAWLERIFRDAGIAPGQQVIAYCRSGPRAALGYMALKAIGCDVRLFDGSYAEWSKAGLPVEK
ncbi:sulfurtransferase [bacterium]|nr:sulfurtransferase [bacterium]